MPSRDPLDMHVRLQEQWQELHDHCAALGIHLFLTCTLRTADEQDALYEQGRTKPGPVVTWVRRWGSFHQPWQDGKALAFDVAFRPTGDPHGATWDGPWEVVGAVAEWLGLEWGGRWRGGKQDRPHFQNRMGRNLAEWRREAGYE